LPGSATLVAVTVTVWAVVIAAGAVYKPFEIVPTAGVRLQVIPVFVVPPTVAVKRAVCDAARETDAGLSETEPGSINVMVAVDDLVESTTLVAITLTVWLVVMFGGAAYRPFEIVPTDGTRLQVTPVLAVLLTVAVNC
jgi:hypothetical protein